MSDLICDHFETCRKACYHGQIHPENGFCCMTECNRIDGIKNVHCRHVTDEDKPSLVLAQMKGETYE